MGGRRTAARLVNSIVADGGEDLAALNGRHVGGAVFRCEVGRPGKKGLKVCTMGENAVWTICIILFVLNNILKIKSNKFLAWLQNNVLVLFLHTNLLSS